MADDDRVEITTFSLPEAVSPLHPVGPLVSSRSRGPPRRSRARGARNLTPLPATRASHLPPPPQYVYAIPPAPTHAGHRADGWNVEKWLKAVRVKVTAKGERGHQTGGCRDGRALRGVPLHSRRAGEHGGGARAGLLAVFRAARGGRGDAQARVPGFGVQAEGRRVGLQARRAGAPGARRPRKGSRRRARRVRARAGGEKKRAGGGGDHGARQAARLFAQGDHTRRRAGKRGEEKADQPRDGKDRRDREARRAHRAAADRRAHRAAAPRVGAARDRRAALDAGRRRRRAGRVSTRRATRGGRTSEPTRAAARLFGSDAARETDKRVCQRVCVFWLCECNNKTRFDILPGNG